jgi:hypothetical protein
MQNTCKQDWRCRRLCKIGRASTRKREAVCKFAGVVGKAAKRKGCGKARDQKALTQADARTLLAAE